MSLINIKENRNSSLIYFRSIRQIILSNVSSYSGVTIAMMESHDIRRHKKWTQKIIRQKNVITKQETSSLVRIQYAVAFLSSHLSDSYCKIKKEHYTSSS